MREIGEINLMVLKMQVINYNHIDKPEQKRCVRQLETCGFKNVSY